MKISNVKFRDKPLRTIILVSIGALVVMALISVVWKLREKASPAPIRIIKSSPSAKSDIGILANQWGFMPGASVETSGLRIYERNFAIVEQDGSGGYPNPAVNLLGTHLEVSGNFSITSRFSEVQSEASIQLYGQVPIIQDEFRVEKPSVRMTIKDNQLVVQLWNDTITPNLARQEPAVTRSFAIKRQIQTEITITRSGGLLTFMVNNQTVGSINEMDIFKSGQIWFGADSPKGTWLLSKLLPIPLNGGTVKVVGASGLPVLGHDSRGLQVLATQKRPGFIVGAAMALAPAVSDTAYANVAFGGNFGSLTTENVLKWQFVEPIEGTFDYHEADALVSLAGSQHMVVHGHTLVFGEANPKWVQDFPTKTVADKHHVEQVMINHINKVVGHFKNRIATWDVVNEPLADYVDFMRGSTELRNHIWYKSMGENYITTAFIAAHKADPGAKLFINDYGLEADGERWDAFVELVARLKVQKVPIDGVGFEAHVYSASDIIDLRTLRQHIQKMGQLGLKVRISEMDVYNDDGEAIQTQQYRDILAACMTEPNCISWTTWGVSDRYDMFQDENKQLQYGADFLWDTNMQPIPAVSEIQKFLLH